MRAVTTLSLLASLSAVALGDVYLHNPRGSNNRLNEANNNRNNGNRLFDSQNNNRGGYNVGDTATTDGAGKMEYIQGSILPVEWTNQHACNSDKNNCNIVIQYACEDHMRDGTNTGTISSTGAENAGGDNNKGKHELKAYYQKCAARQRNKGLFTADQNVNGKDARFTRQNPNGNRRGLECPEERDYYPYWHPTQWKDIAILTSEHEKLCPYYLRETENIKPRYECSKPEHNNAKDCTDDGGNWSADTTRQYPLPLPECKEAPWNRINHHGTTPYNTEAEFAAKGYKNPGEFNAYNWTLPTNVAHDKCVLRLRYNISTGDYNGWDPAVNATLNDEASPVKQNPTIDIGYNRGLTLAVNTAQFGRTFEDRSHIFAIVPRPNSIPAGSRIYNLNVRGRRGNIVQNYPAVEYDFIPKRLTVTTNDYVHFQWTGSNNNPNNDGEGKAQTDRNNIAQIANARANYPLPPSIAGNPSKGGMFPDEATVKQFATLGDTQQKLNNASPYQNFAPMRFTNRGVFHYACLRNNNFSNRSQKGVLIVV